MSQVSELELQNIRHLVLNSDMDIEKYTSYSESATSSDVKEFFKKSVDSAIKNRQELMKFL